MSPSVLFVGESPPPDAPAGFRPFDCASGTRLARSMLGLVDRAVLLEHVPLVNLFDRPTGPKGTPAWSEDGARMAAEAVFETRGSTFRALVLLGARVAAAFGCESLPGPVSVGTIPTVSGGVVVVRVPHPSGASTALNSPDVVREVRRVLLPEIIIGCPTLRPWHFRLDDPAVLEDLALAVSPLRPSAGLVALEWAAAQHKRRLASPPGSLLSRIAIEAAKGCDGAELVIPAWDDSLRSIADHLLAGAEGIERLSAWWDEGGGPKRTVRGRKSWLSQRISEMDDGKRRAQSEDGPLAFRGCPIIGHGLKPYASNLEGLHTALFCDPHDGGHGALADLCATARCLAAMLELWSPLYSIACLGHSPADDLTRLLAALDAPPRRTRA